MEVFIKVPENTILSEKEISWTDRVKIIENKNRIMMDYMFFMPPIPKNYSGSGFLLGTKIADLFDWHYCLNNLFIKKKIKLGNFLDCISFRVAFEAICIIARNNYPHGFSEEDFLQAFGREYPKIKKQFETEYPEMKTKENLLHFLEKETYEKARY